MSLPAVARTVYRAPVPPWLDRRPRMIGRRHRQLSCMASRSPRRFRGRAPSGTWSGKRIHGASGGTAPAGFQSASPARDMVPGAGVLRKDRPRRRRAGQGTEGPAGGSKCGRGARAPRAGPAGRSGDGLIGAGGTLESQQTAYWAAYVQAAQPAAAAGEAAQDHAGADGHGGGGAPGGRG